MSHEAASPAGGEPEASLARDPLTQFRRWFDEAVDAGQQQPEAMALATSGPSGRPSVRFVLMKAFDVRGFVFYTDTRSAKANDLAANPRAALAFRWLAVERQVRVSGPVEPVSPAEADAYFATRPRGAQLGAWASEQSALLAGREVLEERVAEAARRFEGQDVPRPPWWGGYRVGVEEAEFWQGRPDRLHDRWRYRRAGEIWVIERLNP